MKNSVGDTALYIAGVGNFCLTNASLHKGSSRCFDLWVSDVCSVSRITFSWFMAKWYNHSTISVIIGEEKASMNAFFSRKKPRNQCRRERSHLSQLIATECRFILENNFQFHSTTEHSYQQNFSSHSRSTLAQSAPSQRGSQRSGAKALKMSIWGLTSAFRKQIETCSEEFYGQDSVDK